MSDEGWIIIPPTKRRHRFDDVLTLLADWYCDTQFRPLLKEWKHRTHAFGWISRNDVAMALRLCRLRIGITRCYWCRRSLHSMRSKMRSGLHMQTSDLPRRLRTDAGCVEYSGMLRLYYEKLRPNGEWFCRWKCLYCAYMWHKQCYNFVKVAQQRQKSQERRLRK